MFPVYSVTYVPGPYPASRSVGLLNVLHEYAWRGLGRDAGERRRDTPRPGAYASGYFSAAPLGLEPAPKEQ